MAGLYLLTRLLFMHDKWHEGLLPGALTYEAYQQRWADKLAMPLQGMDKEARKYLFYSRYNWERQQRVLDAYEISPALIQAVQSLPAPQSWFVLTDDWCLDSAFALPVIQSAASAAGNTSLVLLPRDNHLGVMDRYLTNGARSIPKLVAFGPDGEACFAWGPAPAELTALRLGWQADGVPGAEISQRKLAWYEDAGWDKIDASLAETIQAGVCAPMTS